MNPTNNTNPIPTTPKSATAAGLLGIFLGAFGAHNWYLGQKQKGIIHVCLFGGGLLLIIIGSAMAAAGTVSSIASYGLSSGSTFLAIIGGIFAFIAYIAMLGNGIWGLVEGIMILVKGDAGLAAQGYTVATAAPVNNVTYPQANAAPATEAKAEEKSEKSEAKSSDKKEA